MTLSLCGEQNLDKERDITSIKSDAHVLNSGLAQAQPIKGRDFIDSDHRRSLSPFYECWVSISGANLTLPEDDHTVDKKQRSFLPANDFSPLLIAIPCVGSKSSHVSILTCLDWCIVHASKS